MTSSLPKIGVSPLIGNIVCYCALPQVVYLSGMHFFAIEALECCSYEYEKIFFGVLIMRMLHLFRCLLQG